MSIVWLASYPKSGNTWVRAFLANLLSGEDKPVHVNRLPGFAFGDHQGHYYAALAGRPFDQLSDAETLRLRPAVQRAIARSRQGDVFVKTHNALGLHDGVPTIAADVTGAFVYVVRNPLDLVVSYAHHYGIAIELAIEQMGSSTNHIVREAATVSQLLGSWSDHVRSWLMPPPQGVAHLVMRYEDISANPRKAFTRLVRFLKLPANAGRIDLAERFSRFKVLADQEATDGFVERPAAAERFFREGRKGGWRGALSSEQAERLVADHREVMSALDYLKADGTVRF